MLLIRDYIAREGLVSIERLAREFYLDTQALQPMLDLWVNKGVIRIYQEKEACQSSCFRCRTKGPMFYQFVDG